MHKQAMEMAKQAMCDAHAKGYDCMTPQDWDDLKDCVEAAEKAIKADYYYMIVCAMKEEEEYEKQEEKWLLKELKEEHGMSEEDSRRFYDAWRYKNGRFAPKGRGTRRGYEEPPYYHVMPEDYEEAEHYRDLDRKDKNRMYFSEPVKNRINQIETNGKNNPNNRTESRYDRARRGYEESKMLDNNSPESKKKSMESLDKYMREIADDMTGLISQMDNSEKAMLKSKLQGLIQKVQ